MTDNSRVRVSIVGVVIVALFCALFARLWFLQMGSEEQLRVQAVSTSTRTVQTETPRGRILDSTGMVLVDNRAAWAITIERTLDEETRGRVLGQLAELLGEPYSAEVLESNFDDLRQSPLKPAIVALNVEEPVRVAVLEHIEDYPGTRVQKLTVRHYTNAAVGAHVLGYVGEISDEQLASRRDDGYQEGDTIGRAGAERAYETDLRGEPRRERLEVDPTGLPVGAPVDVDPGKIGNDVVLTVNTQWQSAAEAALQQGIDAARTVQNENVETGYETLKAPAGAVVALDVTNGEVVLLASNPTYDPTAFIDGISKQEWTDLNDNPNHPLIDRATQGLYSPGSTFKLITALAMTRDKVRGYGETIRDTGSVEIGGRDFNNAGGVAHGRVNLQKALTVSSDVYFYTGGNEFWKRWKAGDPTGLGIQALAREIGFGATTGIELDESAGRVPDPAWQQAFADANYETEAEKRDFGAWLPGRNVNLAVGQGDLLATPLQLANAYATFANGGTRWKPHIGREIRDAEENVVRTIAPEALGQVVIDPAVRAAMQAGFEGVVDDEDGTAYEAFAGFPLDTIPVAGKTGTAQVCQQCPKGDTSWFAAYFPANAPRYVVVAVVEEGGRGGSVAAPIVRRVIEAMTGQIAPEQAAAPIDANDGGLD